MGEGLIGHTYDYITVSRGTGGWRMVPGNEYSAPILKIGKEKRDRTRCSFVCPQFATWEHMATPRVKTLGKPEATMTRGPARLYTCNRRPQAALATNSLCPSEGRIDGSNLGAGRRSLITSAGIAITPHRSECSCHLSERHRPPHHYPGTSLTQGPQTVVICGVVLAV